MSRRVFITAKSLISCAGANLLENLRALSGAKTGFVSMQGVPVGRLVNQTQAEIQNLSQEPITRGQDPVSLLAVLAARQLKEDLLVLKPSLGCIIGSSRGATQSLESAISAFYQTGQVEAKTSPNTTAGSLPASVVRELGLNGMQTSVSAACATGMHAVGNAYAMVKAGILEGAIAGGVECSVSPFTVAMLRRARVYTKFSADALWPQRPLHPGRSGMVLADGAALLCLESQARAESVEVLSYTGASESVGLTGISADGKALQLAISQAVRNAQLKPDDIDLVIGHGASTRKGDDAEWQCYQGFFGEATPPVIFHKWLVGHTLGASASISLAFAVHHLLTQELPHHPYFPELDQGNQKRLRSEINTALIVALGFGGNASAMILQKL